MACEGPHTEFTNDRQKQIHQFFLVLEAKIVSFSLLVCRPLMQILRLKLEGILRPAAWIPEELAVRHPS